MEIGQAPSHFDSKLRQSLKNSFLLEKEIFGQSLKDFKLLCELGRGSSGTVYKAESLLNNKECVLKKIEIKNLKSKHRKNAVKEVEILKKVRHENIIKFYNSFVEDSCLYIVMEYASGGDFQKIINNKKNLKQQFSELEIWDFANQICQALLYLHSHKIIHRDVKALNIFLDKNKKIKLGDLGVSKIVSNQVAINGTRVGTPLYLAPELVKHQPYDNKIDIWAFGCFLYYLAALEPPFMGDNLISLGYNIVNKLPKSIPNNYSETLAKFIMILMEKDIDKRKPMSEVVELIPITKKILEKRENKTNVNSKEEQAIKMFENIPTKKNIEKPEIKRNFIEKEDQIIKTNEFKSQITNESKINEKPIEKKKKNEQSITGEIIKINTEAATERKYNSQEKNKEFEFQSKEEKYQNISKEIKKEKQEDNLSINQNQNEEIEKAINHSKKFKIRPFSANVMISNKQKETKEAIVQNKNPQISLNTNENQLKNLSKAIHDHPTPKQNSHLFRPKSAIIPKMNPITQNQNPILTSRLVNNFVKSEENEMKKELIKESNVTLTSDENRRAQEKIQITEREKNGRVCLEIKDVLPWNSNANNIHSFFYESNKQNNINSNFFFQIFGVQKPLVEKTTKFQTNSSDNISIQIGGSTLKKKEDLTETTQRMFQPKICCNKRDEFLNRKNISSFNFFQPTKPLKNYSPSMLAVNRIKKKFSIRDLIEE